MRFRALSELIGSIYDTVVDPSACPTMLNGLADLLGATGGAQVGAYNSKTHQRHDACPARRPRRITELFKILGRRLAAVRQASDRRRHRPGNAHFSPRSLPHEMFNGSSKPQGPERMMGATLLTEGSVSTVVSVSRPVFRGRVRRGSDQAVRRLDPASAARGAAADTPGGFGRAADEFGRDAEIGCLTPCCWSMRGRG